jgi:hypothetical protein
MRRLVPLVLSSLLVLIGSERAHAQSAQTQHLVQAGNLVYLGKFFLPSDDGSGRPPAESFLSYGGFALGIGPDGQSLYFGCHAQGSRLARVTVPGIGGLASVVERCAAIPNLAAINPGDPNGQQLGGSLSWNGRLVVSGYSFYDGNNSASATHFVGSDTTTLGGPFRVGTDLPGMIAGYMGIVPQEWRGLLGGPALTGQCCLSIISRSSYGPSVSVFDPDQLGAGATPSRMLVGYPDAHQTLGPYDTAGPYFNGATRLGGVAFPAGTRSVLFVGRHASTYCYGEGTGNPALHNTPHPGGGVYCYDPTDYYKGTHGYPYHHQVWAYDANDLLAVRQGLKQPWDVVPYATWTLSNMDGGGGTASIRSATYDPATRRWYIVQDTAGAAPEVHVYEITNAVLQPTRLGPQRFSVRNDPGAWTFSWLPPPQPGWTAYSLEGGSSPGAADIGAVPLPPGVSSISIPSAQGTFFVRLRALYPDGGHVRSSELRISGGTTGNTPTPTNVRAVATGSSIALTWQSAVGAAVSDVVIEAGTAPGRSDLVTGVSIGASGSFVSPPLPAGHYFMRLRAVGGSGLSAASNEVDVVIGGTTVTGPPAPPDAFRATADAARTVTLTWENIGEGPAPTGFRLDVGSGAGLSDLVVGLAVPLGTRYVLPGVPPGVYYVRLRAVNSGGSSAPGAEVRLVVP